MYFCYFDEVKTDLINNKHNFFIGGISIDQSDIMDIEKTLDLIAFNFFGTSVLGKGNEFHGSYIVHGKGAFKGREVTTRLALIKDLTNLLTDSRINKFTTRINVIEHKEKYQYPMPEYNFGLMLHLENTDSFLKEKRKKGILFGDYERDNTENSIISLSEFKNSKTKFYKGKQITQLVDTIYFAHSHHSRFIQLADVFLYLAHLRFYNDRSKKLQKAVLEHVDSITFMKDIYQKDSWNNK